MVKLNLKNGEGALSVGEVREVLGVEFTLVTFVMLVVLVRFLECLKKRMSQFKAFIFFTHLYSSLSAAGHFDW
jgi:hypothetical protein